MATNPLGAESARNNPRYFTPVPSLGLVFSSRDRKALAAFVEAAINLMDVLDGEDDLELNGDEADHNQAEDDFCKWRKKGEGPGCDIGDPGGCEHDGRETEEYV